jgi:hypothetical protein
MFTVNEVLKRAFYEHLYHMRPGDKRYKSSSTKHMSTGRDMLHSMIKLENDNDCMVFFVSSGERSKDNKHLKGGHNKVTKGDLVYIDRDGRVIKIEQKKILRQENNYSVHTDEVIQDMRVANNRLAQSCQVNVPCFFRQKSEQGKRMASVQPDLGQSLYAWVTANNSQYDHRHVVMAIDQAMANVHHVVSAHCDLKPENFACSENPMGQMVITALDFPGDETTAYTPHYLHIKQLSKQNDFYACFQTQYFGAKHSQKYATDPNYRPFVEAIRRTAQQAFLMCLINNEDNNAVYTWARDGFYNAQCQNSELINNLITAYNESEDPWIKQWRMLEEQCTIINDLLTLDPPRTLCEFLENGSPQYYYEMQNKKSEQYALPTLSTIIINMLSSGNRSIALNILRHQTDDHLILMLQHFKQNNAKMNQERFIQHCEDYLPPYPHTWLQWDGTIQVAFFLLNCLAFGALFFISTMLNDDRLSTQPMHRVLFISMMIGNFATAGILTAILGFIGNVGACPNVLGCYKNPRY